MKRLKAPLLAAAAAAVTLTISPVEMQAQASDTIPIEVWSLRDVVNAVEVSPDGKHVLVHVMTSREREYLLQIYKTDDMSKPFRTLNADPMEIISAEWVNDNYIYGTAWEQRRKRVPRPEAGTYDQQSYAYNLETNSFSRQSDNFALENKLPKDDDHIIVAQRELNFGGGGVDPFAFARPISYYKLNLKTGSKRLVLKGNDKFRTAVFDNDGYPRWTRGREGGSDELITYYRRPGESSWNEFERYDEGKHENLYRTLSGFMGLRGFDPNDPNIGYVIANRGEDKAALWEFNFETGQYGQKLAGTDKADIMWTRTHSIPGNDTLVAAGYPWAKREYVWFDEQEKALYEALEKQIPYAHEIRITSRSRDGNTMIVTNRGPRDPGSFWMVKDGGMVKLGSRNPLIKPQQLSDVEFIRYPARDGKMITGYVTKPAGEGPFPLIVLPHGGPHVNEVITYDEWGQFLANQGYMVLQPQYRMSVGHGQALFDAAFGQHGLAMQDDKDDGALYLVEKGWADPDRMAMFGWSYGGYAALVAASREPNLYQCVIAGAAVADPEKVYRMRSNPYTPKAIDEWAQRRGMTTINPIKEVSKVNVPLLMIHGDVDARVMYFNFEDYKKAIQAAGKTDAQFLTLKGADHFYVTLMYEHQQAMYTKMTDFLKNDCGPGGL